MQLRKRVLWLLAIMIVVTLCVGFTTVSIFYQTAFREEKSSLSELVISQSRLIESIYRFNKKFESQYPNGAKEATLSQITDSHDRYERFSDTGEILFAEKRGDTIHFIFSHAQDQIIKPDLVHTGLGIAVPMTLALSGQFGTTIATDYSGKKVLAAYGHVPDLDYGIVAKIDISEIRSPFIKAITVTILIGITVIILGIILFFRISNPIIQEMADTIKNLKETLDHVKLLSGLLPICASCKKIKDDKGHWNQIESYINNHSEAKFSHGICPECAEKLYPEFNLYKK